MYILSEGSVFPMSVVVAVCGFNFCALLSDSRQVKDVGGEWEKIGDNFDKITQINSSIIFGATGLFYGQEKITSALCYVQDPKNATIDDIYNSVIKYVHNDMFGGEFLKALKPTRNYLFGGKDSNGVFCLYELHVDFEKHKIDETITKMTTAGLKTAISLPWGAEGKQNYFLEKVTNCAMISKSINELAQRIASVIDEISEIDNTVGGDVRMTYVM